MRTDTKSIFLSRWKLFCEQKSQISQTSQVYGKISQKYSARNFQIEGYVRHSMESTQHDPMDIHVKTRPA